VPPDPEPNSESGAAPVPVPGGDVTRRTWLAAERTWLAWWRTGLATAGIALAIGRLLPGVIGGTRWPYRALGLGYAMLSVAVLLIGGRRQLRASHALRRGEFEELSSPLVMWLTAAAVLLSTGTLIVVLAAF
jgi:putative membrane protein